MQLGLLALSAMLASHSVDEAKRYSANACYELRDDTATPLKLVRVFDTCCVLDAQAVAMSVAATENSCCYLGAMIQRTTTAPHLAV